MAVNSRTKGKVGELSACAELHRLFGWTCRRSQQFSGWAKGGASADILVDQTPSIFWEVKRVQALNVPKALALATNQCGRMIPVVMHRPNRSVNGWMLTIRLTDLPRLCHAYTTATDSEAAAATTVATQTLPTEDSNCGASGASAAGTPRPLLNRRGASADKDHLVARVKHGRHAD